MRKDKEIYTITVPCNGQDHQISLTKEGKLELLNHADDEIETELALEKLGGRLPECLKIQKAWKNNSYYLEHRDDDPILDKAITYLDFAYKSRNSFKKKILGLFGIIVASLMISVIISLIQRTFDLFWIYTFASVNIVFAFYYVFLFLDSSSELVVFLVPFIVVAEFLSYLYSLYDFKILSGVMLTIFMLLYFVPIIGNKILLGLVKEIEKD